MCNLNPWYVHITNWFHDYHEFNSWCHELKSWFHELNSYDVTKTNFRYVHITNLDVGNSWYGMYISEISFRDIMNLIRDITNWIHDITKSIRDMYILRIQITHIANSGLNSKRAFHKALPHDISWLPRYSTLHYSRSSNIHFHRSKTTTHKRPYTTLIHRPV